MSNEYGMPNIRTKVILENESGQQVAPQIDFTLIRQKNAVIEPTRIYQQGSEWVIEWVPDIELVNSSNSVNDIEFEIIYSEFAEIIVESSELNGIQLPIISILSNITLQRIDQLTLPNNNGTFTSRAQFNLRIGRGVFSEAGEELPIILDSLVYDSTVFKIFPSIRLDDELGTDIQILFNVTFKPPAFLRYSTVATFYFNGGYKYDFELLGNNILIDRNYNIELLRPQPREAIAPCTEYDITWTGSKPGIPTIVKASYDGGQTFFNLGFTLDTFYRWTVPDSITEFLQIKIEQDNQTTANDYLLPGRSDLGKIAVSGNGQRVAYASEEARVWTVNKSSGISSEIFRQTQGSRSINDMTFVGNDTFLLAYHRIRFGQRWDSIAMYSASQNRLLEVFESDINIEKFKNFKDGKILLSSELSQKVYSFDYSNGDFGEELSVNFPIADFSYSSETDAIAITGIQGFVTIIDANTLIETDNFTISNFGEPDIVVFSPDGKYVAATKKYYSGVQNIIQIYDLDDEGKRVRRIPLAFGTNTRELSFNETSRQLVLAHGFNPQLVIYDITDNSVESLDNSGSVYELMDINLARDDDVLASVSRNSQEGQLVIYDIEYPQYDQNDIYAHIRPADLTINTIVVTSGLVADSTFFISETEICNNSSAPFPIKDIFFENNIHFELIGYDGEGLVMPGECLSLEIAFKPKTIGLLYDTLTVSDCVNDFRFPVEGFSIERNPLIAEVPFDLGELCIGERNEVDLTIFTNTDTAAIFINSMKFTGNGGLFARYTARDSIEVMEDLDISVTMVPFERGQIVDTLYIYNSNMVDENPLEVIFTYRSIGSDAYQDHSYLAFTPEQPIRGSYIVNEEETDITITDFTLLSGTAHTVDIDLPVTLGFGDTLKFSVETSDYTVYDSLSFSAVPCLGVKPIVLGPYISNTKLYATEVESKPTEYATLEFVQETNTQNFFKGLLNLDFSFKIDLEGFYPLEFVSDFEIVSTSFQPDGEDWLVDVSLRGDFIEIDTVLKVIGPAALTEKVEYPIAIQDTSNFFTSSLNTTVSDGKLIIINDSPGRLIFAPGQGTVSFSIYPNPTADRLHIVLKEIIEIDKQLSLRYSIMDMTGREVTGSYQSQTLINSDEIIIEVSYLNSGNYTLILTPGTMTSRENTSNDNLGSQIQTFAIPFRIIK
ncbi:MAG: hypothetical protein Kapaf2KO_22910 [Candidatus Kapaibacteriales bacterium]